MSDNNTTETTPERLRMLLIHDLAGQIIEMVSEPGHQSAIADAGSLIRKAATLFDGPLSGAPALSGFIADIGRSLAYAQTRKWPKQMTLSVSSIRSLLVAVLNGETVP
ncbi:hypothetical protein [Acetobacter peroxydans]|uniref:Uncharacterized protein n=1 Tax=Acetobacter peroxydans TaxID=104098 RepID=A0A4Y3TXT0_9PROT|nr:hypothetical protein [Acetobacter peroxydans]NHO17063.1 hypothetical protein [Acetobacter peroxydans]GBR36666.1 hypothetical protein AA13755_1593 [Acetobacter peroxydans NBRC 13755]GBR39553.1 hypothetical protein AA0475_0242 [Acetobacter peroxydans]GEB86574.1 hypothetical protein APE01nite_23710 [Acetobacter peroxydans]